MIERLIIENFKCLQHVDVTLGPFTILIGPNDSGKTSLLEAIEYLGMTTTKQWNQSPDATPLKEILWRKDSSRTLSFKATGTCAAGTFHYALRLNQQTAFPDQEILKVNESTTFSLLREGAEGNQCVVKSEGSKLPLSRWGTGLHALSQGELNPQVAGVVYGLRSTVKYRLQPAAMRKPVALVQDPVLSSSGDNLAAVVDAILTGPDRQATLDLEKSLRDEIPSLRGVSTRPGTSGTNTKTIEFTLESNSHPLVSIPATLASDGALLLLAFLVLGHGNTPDILFIEEPENGLHYARLEQVVRLLRKISQGKIGGRPRQVIVTTHSPILLNFAEPSEVRIFRRDPERGTIITPMEKAPNLSNLGKEFGTGELWYMLGEEGLLQGVGP